MTHKKSQSEASLLFDVVNQARWYDTMFNPKWGEQTAYQKLAHYQANHGVEITIDN